MPFAEGENIGPYRIIEKLGQGGMATVYKAYHAALDRFVALKVLHPAFLEDQTFTGRFQREARVVAKLEHPSIVPIYDYADHENHPYLVMKYIEGETLKARLSRGPLSSDEISQVVDAVGSAMAYAHDQGILHRDIKPSNVLINEDGQMYLADFGLARIAQAGQSTLSSDSIMGTPQYISPEQARGDKDLDIGTDIYSFGVMLYEMVVGQVPFSADTPFSIIHDHIYTPLPLPRVINDKVPESVEKVLLKALAKERVDRYEDVASMVVAFKEAWQSAGVPMKGTALTLPAATFKKDKGARKTKVGTDAKTTVGKEPKKKRSPWLFIAGGILLTVCCLFAFVVIRENRNNQGPRQDQNPDSTQVVDTPLDGEPPPGPAPDEVPQEVRQAKRNADNNPGDPHAQLELALAFWDADMHRESYITVNKVLEFQALDSGFFIDAGNRFHERKAWIASASLYLQVHKRAGPHGEIPGEVEMNFREAVYMSASSPELKEMVSKSLIDEVMNVDQPIGLVAKARLAFYSGDLKEAERHLNKVFRMDSDMVEARLLEGEMAVIDERFETAELILAPLSADLNVPLWIQVFVEDLMNSIPQS